MEFDLTSGELGGALLPSQLPSLLPSQGAWYAKKHGHKDAASTWAEKFMCGKCCQMSKASRRGPCLDSSCIYLE